MSFPKPSRRIWPGALFLALGLLATDALRGETPLGDVAVTVTSRTPITELSPQGEVTGVMEATPGTHYTFISSDGSQVTVEDSAGARYRLRLQATDYVAPSPVASETAPAPPASPVSTNATVTSADQTSSLGSPSPSSLPPSTTEGATTSDAVATINAGLGKPLFSSASLWEESALLIANRLELKLEDKTKWESSYRRYFYDENGRYAPALVLGGAAYCIALYADAQDHATSLLIAFTNDGDFAEAGPTAEALYRLRHASTAAPGADQEMADLEKKFHGAQFSFEAIRQREQVTLIHNLSALFGAPREVTFGSDEATRENALRWDWNGVSFLFTSTGGRYNLLRVIPTALADAGGRTERIPLDVMKAKLSDAVEHRPNGDVVITQLPMADQGAKGYCVPATWERVLRYTGVPGDMYTLSRIGGAGFGGGENGANIAAQLDETLHDYGRRAEMLDIDKIDAVSLHRYIDEGIPVFWSVNPAGYAPVLQRYGLCDRDKDWDEWKILLGQARVSDKSHQAPLVDYIGHQVLITGYNPETHEIAWSDPWGRQTSERWMTEEEAQRCSLNQFYVIMW